MEAEDVVEDVEAGDAEADDERSASSSLPAARAVQPSLFASRIETTFSLYYLLALQSAENIR